MTYLDDSGSRSLVRLQSRCWLGLKLSQDSTGAEESASKMAHSCDSQKMASVPCYCQKTSVPCHINVLWDYMSVFTPWLQASPQSGLAKEKIKEESTNNCYKQGKVNTHIGLLPASQKRRLKEEIRNVNTHFSFLLRKLETGFYYLEHAEVSSIYILSAT